MSAISINPLSFSQRQLIDPKGNPRVPEINKFLNDLAQWTNQMQQTLINPANLVSNMNGNRLINGKALSFKDAPLGTVSTNQTVNCAGAAHVVVTLTFTAAITVTLTNLDAGVPVFMQAINTTGGALVLKCAASNPSSVSYSVFVKGSGNPVADFTATGVSIATNSQNWFWGINNSVSLFCMEI